MNNIEKARKALGLKQSEVCRRVGITPRYEKRNPSRHLMKDFLRES